MRKQIPDSVKERLNRIKTAIEDVPNTVPNEMRTTFNFKGRKSPEIAERVIEAVCDSEDIIFDPFDLEDVCNRITNPNPFSKVSKYIKEMIRLENI